MIRIPEEQELDGMLIETQSGHIYQIYKIFELRDQSTSSTMWALGYKNTRSPISNTPRLFYWEIVMRFQMGHWKPVSVKKLEDD